MNVMIQKTTNYDMFELASFNRDIRPRILAKIEKSMKKHGFIDSCPVRVTKQRNCKCVVQDGHHRIVAASNLGIPVSYVICDDNATMHELLESSSEWNTKDFLDSYFRTGDEDYAEVRTYCERTGIAVGMAVSMFGGDMASSCGSSAAFKSGRFAIKNRMHPEEVAKIIKMLVDKKVDGARTRLSICSISRILSGGHADFSRLCAKIKAYSHLIEKKASIKSYMEMWESIYNRGEREKIPLEFLTEETIRSRNALRIVNMSKENKK